MEDTQHLKEAFNQLIELLTDNDYNGLKVMIVCIAGIFTFVLGMVLLVKGYFTYETRNKKKCRKAQQLGHIVPATLISSEHRYTTQTNENTGREWKDWYYRGIYQYYVDGKEYIYYLDTENKSPQSLTLYYIKKPKRAFHAGKATWQPVILIYIMPLFVMAALIYLLGVKPF